MKFNKRFSSMLALAVVLSCCSSWSAGQTAATTRKPTSGRVVVERQSAAPQVITVVHRINGLKMLRLLMHSGEGVSAIDPMDEAFGMAGQVHTNIIAGLALDDGATIVAWLPEAEAEVEAALPFAPRSPAVPIAEQAPLSPMARKAEPSPVDIFARPDITIIERDGRRRDVSYIGLDGVTGLSLLRLSARDLRSRSNLGELDISVGERLRLFSPEPVRETKASTNDAIYVRIGETESEVTSIVRGGSGEISRIRIKSMKLTPSNVGGVAVNDAGQTIGIVENIEGNEASILSPTVILAAAKRVLARQTSVPRPWLGVSGVPVAFTSLDKIVDQGWETGRAMSLLKRQRGILLNAITPGSPAAFAALRAGDVIVSVNDNDVKSTDDFSLFLIEGGGKPVRFTIVRPDTETVESIVVSLSETRDPFRAKMFDDLPGPRAWLANPLVEHGIESVPLRPANPLSGAASGLLVVYVRPTCAAFKSGLRSGDVIEAIDGQTISALSASAKLELTNTSYALTVLRGKERLVLQVVESER